MRLSISTLVVALLTVFFLSNDQPDVHQVGTFFTAYAGAIALLVWDMTELVS